MARMCIITRKEVPKNSGTPIREDGIIRGIRAIKGKLGILQNNELVVSDEALDEYKKKREKFEKMAVIHTTVAAIIVIVFIFAPLFLGAPFNPMGIIFSIIIGLLFAAFSLLGYVPSLDDGSPSKVPTPSQIASRLMPKAFLKKSADKKAPPIASRKPAPKAQAKPAPKKAYKRKKRR